MKKKLDKRTIIAIAISASVVVDIVLAIIFIPKFIKGKNSSSEPYVVKEETITTYENMKSYINDNIEYLVGYEDIKDIYALQFSEKTLYIAGVGETDPIYIEMGTSCNDIYECLDLFSTTSIPETTFQIRRENHFDKELDIKGKKIVGEVTSNKYKMYASFTIEFKDGRLGSLVHQEYTDTIDENKITTVTYGDNNSLYDFYYYLLNK